MTTQRMVVAILLLLALATPRGAEGQGMEAQVKAALLCNLTRFIAWPDSCLRSSKDPIVIGLLAAPELRKGIEDVRRSSGGLHRSIEVRTVDTPVQAAACHVLYLGPTAAPDGWRRAGEVSGYSLLVVADPEAASGAAATVRLVRNDNRLAFIVDLAEAERNGLRVSSKLLNLAVEVKGHHRGAIH